MEKTKVITIFILLQSVSGILPYYWPSFTFLRKLHKMAMTNMFSCIWLIFSPNYFYSFWWRRESGYNKYDVLTVENILQQCSWLWIYFTSSTNVAASNIVWKIQQFWSVQKLEVWLRPWNRSGKRDYEALKILGQK